MNPVGWFEIPVADMNRAISFYNAVFDYNLETNQLGPLEMAWLPSDENARGTAGSLVYNEEYYQPSTNGILIYFSCLDVAENLSRVEKAGGKVLRSKTLIAEDIGYMGLILDSEGNRIGVHSRK